MQTLTITKPDDWHVHFRDGENMASVAGATARQFGRAIVMPNLKPPVVTAAQAKAYASEAANRACWDALQVHGGNGFSEEYEIARLYRDVRVTTIYEGTSEMQRLVIARHLLVS